MTQLSDNEKRVAAGLNDHQFHVLKNIFEQQAKESQQQAKNPQQKAQSHSFMAEAKRISANKEIPLSQAMQILAMEKPKLHADFIREVNQ